MIVLYITMSIDYYKLIGCRGDVMDARMMGRGCGLGLGGMRIKRRRAGSGGDGTFSFCAL